MVQAAGKSVPQGKLRQALWRRNRAAAPHPGSLSPARLSSECTLSSGGHAVLGLTCPVSAQAWAARWSAAIRTLPGCAAGGHSLPSLRRPAGQGVGSWVEAGVTGGGPARGQQTAQERTAAPPPWGPEPRARGQRGGEAVNLLSPGTSLLPKPLPALLQAGHLSCPLQASEAQDSLQGPKSHGEDTSISSTIPPPTPGLSTGDYAAVVSSLVAEDSASAHVRPKVAQ